MYSVYCRVYILNYKLYSVYCRVYSAVLCTRVLEKVKSLDALYGREREKLLIRKFNTFYRGLNKTLCRVYIVEFTDCFGYWATVTVVKGSIKQSLHIEQATQEKILYENRQPCDRSLNTLPWHYSFGSQNQNQILMLT